MRKDVNKFTTIARQLKDSGDMAAWEQTAALGRTVDPGNPMYGEATGEAPAAVPDILSDTGKQGVQPLDMDVGFNIPMDLDVTAAAHAAQPEAGSMDFDVSAYSSLPAMDMDVTGAHEIAHEPLLPDFDVTGGHPPETGAQAMDFDVTGSHPNVVGSTSMDFDVTGSHPNVLESSGMDFDVTGSHTGVTAAAAGANMSTVVLDTQMDFGTSPAAAVEALSGGMDFDLSASPASTDLGTGMETSFLEPAGTETAGSGMDFDISASPSAAALSAGTETSIAETSILEPSGFGMDFDLNASPSVAAPAPAAPAAETSGLGMDFDLGATPAAAPAAAAPAMETFAGLGGLDFNITGSGAPAAPEQPGANMSTVVLSELMDFDVSTPSVTAAASAEAPSEFGALDFDVTGEHPVVPEAPVEDTTSTVILSAPMDFDISAPAPAMTPAAEAPAPAAGGMDFDLSASSSMVIPAVGGALTDLGGMDFDVSIPQGTRAEPAMDLSGINLDVSAGEGASVSDTVVLRAAEAKKDERWQEVENKLDLAKAFLTGMGDVDTARELLGEVLNEGDAQQIETARGLIQQI